MTTFRFFRSSLVAAVLTFTSFHSATAAEVNRSLIASTAISTTLNATPAPQRAPQRVRWTPNRRMGSPRSTLSGGRRGQSLATCEFGKQLQPASLTLLVPNIEDGLLTTAAHPSFFWHVETSAPIAARFILSDPNTAEPIYTRSLKIHHSGIAQVDLPAEIALKAGTRYRWTVLLSCGEGSGEIAARSFIERVSEPNLKASDSAIEQATTFAANGIWYDALKSLIRATQADPTNQALKRELRSLLSQVGQRQVELARLLEAFDPS